MYFNDSSYSYDSLIKTASIIGTFLVATTTSLTGNASLGVLSIAVLLVAALVFLLLQKGPDAGVICRPSATLRRGRHLATPATGPNSNGPSPLDHLRSR